MTNYLLLQPAIEAYVLQKFSKHSDKRLVYHDTEHTKKVVASAIQIANHYQLNERDFFIVYTGAWFHDTGYLDAPQQHESKGAQYAEEFLQDNQVDLATIAEIKEAILATQLPQKPKNLNDKILCDADLFHLGSEEFSARSKLLHQEVEQLCGKEFSKREWRMKDIAFLENHSYHTDYCKLLLNDQKQKNLDKLKKKLAENDLKAISSEENNKHKEHQKAEKPKKAEEFSKGVETLFRITSTNNQRLSDMADNKAQILITVNSIILSLVVSLLLRRLEDNAYLVVPTFMLLLVSLSCIVFSILATRPSIPAGVFTPDEVEKKTVNLVFFGNFYKMPLADYHHSMQKVMGDRDFLYGTLIKDVYAQGVVLGKKYKLIRIAYNIFMFGLIATVLTYITTYIAYGKLT